MRMIFHALKGISHIRPWARHHDRENHRRDRVALPNPVSKRAVMKFMALTFPLWMVLLASATSAQTIWDTYPNNIALDVGDAGDWDAVHVSHPAVYHDGSQFHLWYAGSNSSEWAIGYARSDDGKTWEKYPGNPVLQDGIGDVWDSEFVTQPTVLYADSTYRMWYGGYDGKQMRIGYATSPDGITWTKHGSNPVLAPGSTGEWDAAGVSGPGVQLDSDGYHMWYTGYDGTTTRIGYATSADGIDWTKEPSNPVLDVGAAGFWDSDGVSGSTVVVTTLMARDTHRMWYAGTDGSETRVGYASSTDGGLTWKKYPTNPTSPTSTSWDARWQNSPCVLAVNSIYHLWYTGYDGSHMRIGYASSMIPADTSGDGHLSAYDAGLILQYVVGIIDSFPVLQQGAPDGVEPLPAYQMRLPQFSARAGETIHARLEVEDATGLFTGGLRFTYDPTILRAIEALPLDMLSRSYWQANMPVEGEIRFAFVAPGSLRESGGLMEILFEVLAGSEGRETPLRLASSEWNDGVPVRIEQGLVRVVPSETRLLPNYPNPFNPETWFPYELAEDGPVWVTIYDAAGHPVRRWMLSYQRAGVYRTRDRAIHWDGRDALGRPVASGTYFSHFRANHSESIRKATIIR